MFAQFFVVQPFHKPLKQLRLEVKPAVRCVELLSPVLLSFSHFGGHFLPRFRSLGCSVHPAAPLQYGARGVYVPQWDMQLFFGGYGFQTMQCLGSQREEAPQLPESAKSRGPIISMLRPRHPMLSKLDFGSGFRG